jgi:hypothetical protein
MKLMIKLRFLVFLFFAFMDLNAQIIEHRDCAEIRIQAEQTLRRFAILLNQIADPTFFSFERNDLIQNSFKQDNPGRIFYDSSVIVENDLNPIESQEKNAGLNDKNVMRYLHDFDLIYSKQEKESVFFTNLHFGPIRKNEYVFLHIHYNSELQGHLKDEPNRKLPGRQRVATIRAEKTEGQWRTYILQVNFFSAGFEFVLNHQDADCDGIVDQADDCPEEAGSKRWGGCPPPPHPDLDRDGMVDTEDRCPDRMGPWCAQGCPLQKTEGTREKQVLWQELMGNAGSDAAFDITKNEQGEIVFAGETEIAGKGKDLYMAVFDPCRKYISNRLVLGGAQNDGARKVIPIASGKYALAGYTESSGSGSRDAWLLLTDGTQKTGEKFFGTGRSSEAFTDIVKDTRDNLVFTGQKDGKIWLLQTSLDGKVSNEVLYRGSDRAAGTALALSPGGEIFLTGYETVEGRENLLVLHYNEATGRLEKIYEKANAKGLDLIVDREEQLVVAGIVYSKRTRDDIFIVRLDQKGNILWDEEKTFGGIGIDVGCAVLETVEGNYALAGYSSSYADGARREKLWAHLLNRSGNSIWEEPLFWGERFSERAYCITQIESNGIIVAGSSHSSLPSKKAQKSDFWLVSIRLLAKPQELSFPKKGWKDGNRKP